MRYVAAVNISAAISMSVRLMMGWHREAVTGNTWAELRDINRWKYLEPDERVPQRSNAKHT